MVLESSYILSDPITGIVRYVGKTERGIDVRFIEHRYNARKGRDHVYCWWRKVVRDTELEPTIEVIETYETIMDMNAGEKFWIEYLRFVGANLTNKSDGGEGQTGYRHTQATKDKISDSQRGVKRPRFYKGPAIRAISKDGMYLDFPDLKTASEELNLIRSHVWAIINKSGRLKTHRGFSFELLR